MGLTLVIKRKFFNIYHW